MCKVEIASVDAIDLHNPARASAGLTNLFRRGERAYTGLKPSDIN
jgi:hypothetical protein